MNNGASGNILSPTFYSHKGTLLEENTWSHSGSIHEHNNIDSLQQYSPTWANSKEIYIPGFISKDISGAISVAYPIESFFWDFLLEKGVFSDTGSD